MEPVCGTNNSLGKKLPKVSSAPVGYLAILLAGLLLSLGVRFESNRQYLSTWQHYLESQQLKSRDYEKRVKTFFSALNDNLGTLSFLPSVRKIDRRGFNLGTDGHETIQQVYNNLTKNVEVTKVYIVPLNFDAKSQDPVTGKLEEPILTLDQMMVRSQATSRGNALPSLPLPAAAKAPEFQQLQKQLQWFKINYPNIQRLKTSAVPMISGQEIITSDTSNTIKPKQDSDRAGLVFSVPFFGQDGKLAGSVSAIIFSSVLRGITDSENYSLISPLAEYVSVPLKRDKNIKLMLRAADNIPAESQYFRKQWLWIPTMRAESGNCTSNILLPLTTPGSNSGPKELLSTVHTGRWGCLPFWALAGIAAMCGAQGNEGKYFRPAERER